MNMNSIVVFALILIFHASSSFAFDDLPNDNCTNFARRVTSSATPSASDIDSCLSSCFVSRSHHQYNDMMVNYQICQRKKQQLPDPNTINQCSAATDALKNCTSDCQSLFVSCSTTCRTISDETTRNTALALCDKHNAGKKKVPIDPAGKDPKPEPEPVDPAGKDPAPVDPNDPSDPGNAEDPRDNTGDPNVISQQPALNGIGTSPYGDTNIGSTDASAIDFTTGLRTDRDAYQRLNQSGGVDTQFVGTGANPEMPFDGEEVKGSPAQANAAGPNGGGGQPGMPFGPGAGGGGPLPNNANASGGRRGGGNYRNSAGDYLSRHSPFSYQSGGGDRSVHGSTANRNVANKKQFGPKYQKKANDGKDALHRLFGNGLAPTSYRRNPYGACNGSVFCPVEVFYNKIERLPNHDINPDSY